MNEPFTINKKKKNSPVKKDLECIDKFAGEFSFPGLTPEMINKIIDFEYDDLSLIPKI